MKTNKILKIFVTAILLISIQTAVIAATGVVNVDTVRVRKRATTSSAIIELVSIGDKITIIGEEDNWYKVKVNGKEGYIRKDLLTVEGELTFEEEPEKPSENSGNSNETPNQTEEPNTNGEVTGEETPNQGTEVPAEQPNQGNIVAAEKNDRTISVMKTTEKVSAGQKLQLTEEVKIKILPSANSSNIAKIQANTEITVLEVMNSWCRIETAEGACGWVRIDQ